MSRRRFMVGGLGAMAAGAILPRMPAMLAEPTPSYRIQISEDGSTWRSVGREHGSPWMAIMDEVAYYPIGADRTATSAFSVG